MKSISKKRIIQLVMLFTLALVLTGCVQYDSTGQPTGWVYEYIGQPTAYFLDWIAGLFNGSYGVAIIILTILTRIVMVPASFNMTKNSMISQAKMKFAQPEIDEINAELKETNDPELQKELQAELMATYKKYDVNMMGGLGGCLPLLIQLPILSAVYAAIRSSEQIAQSTFLGINLGQRSLGITIAVVLVTALQGWLQMKTMPQTDNEQAQATTRSMMLMTPLMLGYGTWVSAAGLGVYFLTGGLFMIIQQLYTAHILRPRVNKLIESEADKYKNLPKRKRKAPVKNKQNEGRIVPVKQNFSNKRRRNEGIQQRRPHHKK